ncbi:MAG: biotin/lipoyl-containing protein [Thermodesulfobacteriota bacterium]|nr:biotin/lipoyl-containing protein [Thermodesulfobacteriota bacterium]
MNIKTLKDLIELIKDTDIVDLEWTPDRIHLVRSMNAGIADTGSLSDSGSRVSSTKGDKDRPTVSVSSPLVGIFYRSSSPETQPFVQVGTDVTKGQCLCVIEAMKLMNEIESQVDGTVTAILKKDSERVGYGDPLFIIEEA